MGSSVLRNAALDRQQGSALPRCVTFNVVEDSLLRTCFLLSQGSAQGFQT